MLAGITCKARRSRRSVLSRDVPSATCDLEKGGQRRNKPAQASALLHHLSKALRSGSWALFTLFRPFFHFSQPASRVSQAIPSRRAPLPGPGQDRKRKPYERGCSLALVYLQVYKLHSLLPTSSKTLCGTAPDRRSLQTSDFTRACSKEPEGPSTTRRCKRSQTHGSTTAPSPRRPAPVFLLGWRLLHGSQRHWPTPRKT